MTREEVKEQLAKNPLEWESRDAFNEQDTLLRASIVLMPQEDDTEGDDKLYLEFTLSTNRKCKYSEVYFGARRNWNFGTYEIASAVGVEVPVDELKQIAEDHRLDLACRLLGVAE